MNISELADASILIGCSARWRRLLQKGGRIRPCPDRLLVSSLDTNVPWLTCPKGKEPNG